MPRPLAPMFRVLAIAIVVALPFAFLGACTTETGVTPNCVPDVGVDGVTPVENGCTGHAVCIENPTNPSVCCRAADVEVDGGGKVKGAPYTGDTLAFCLLSYGIGAPTSAASSSSASSSSSTSTGTGG